MQFTLYSCFVTHSESVVLVECPNLHRAPAFIPPLYPSSITLAALFSSSPFPLITSPYYSAPSHYNILILCSKSLQYY